MAEFWRMSIFILFFYHLVLDEVAMQVHDRGVFLHSRTSSVRQRKQKLPN